MADQVIIKNGFVQSVVQNNTNHHLQPIPRQIPVTPLQYALTDLHIGEVPIPSDMQPRIPGCSQEVITTSISSSSHSMLSTAGPSYLNVACTPTIQEDVAVENTGSYNPRLTQEAPPQNQNKRRVRRTAILPTMNPQPSQETLFVPANHPLLKVRNEELESPVPMACEQNNSYLPNGMKIQIVPPTEQISTSMGTVVTPTNDNRLRRLRPQLYPAFNEGRRASEGNPANAPFRQVLHNAEIQATLRREQNELLQLQQNYQRSLTPEQIIQQQQDHVAYRDTQHERWLAPQPSTLIPRNNNSFVPSLDFIADCTPERSMDEGEDFEMTSLSSAAPGPFRRQHSYRKLSNSPINVVLHKNSSKRHRKQSIIPDNLSVSPNLNQYDSFS